MSERITLLVSVELALARSSAERRTQIALQLTELFVQCANRLSETLIDTFDELITRVAAEIDKSAQVMLAQRLARFENAPVKTTRACRFRSH